MHGPNDDEMWRGQIAIEEDSHSFDLLRSRAALFDELFQPSLHRTIK